MVSLNDALYDFRLRIRKNSSEVSDPEALSYLNEAADLIAQHYGFAEQEEYHTIGIEENKWLYPLPDEFLMLQSAQWNGTTLDYSTVEEWENRKIAYMSSEPGMLKQVAVSGNQLILYPRPSASAISADSNISIRYKRTSKPINEQGFVGWKDAHVRTAVLYAAQQYLYSKGDFNHAAALQRQIEHRMMLGDITEQHPIGTHYPTMNPVVTNPRGGGR